MSRRLEITRWPARVGGVVVVSEGENSAQLQWQHQISASDFQIGLWDAGEMHELSTQEATATVTIPEPWEQVSETLGVWSSTVYPEFDPDEEAYVGTYEDDPSKVIMLNNRSYSGDIVFYWNTDKGIWRVLRCNSGDSCDYGTPGSTDVRALRTISGSHFPVVQLGGRSRGLGRGLQGRRRGAGGGGERRRHGHLPRSIELRALQPAEQYNAVRDSGGPARRQAIPGSPRHHQRRTRGDVVVPGHGRDGRFRRRAHRR